MSHKTNLLNTCKALVNLIAITLLIVMLNVSNAIAQSPTVKMSNSKICHDKSSPHYARTKNYCNYPVK